MKKYFILVLLLIFMLSGCVVENPNGSLTDNNQTNNNTQDNNQNNNPNEDNNENNNNNENNDNNENNNNDNNDNNDDNLNEDNNDNTNTDNKFNLSSPNFTVREISSIDDVTMDDFFNLGNRIDIKVNVSNDELKKLQADYETFSKYGHKSEIYHLASKVEISLTNYGKTFTWEFENVGIRQKGNTSRTNIFNGNDGLNLNHYKLSFDETFNDLEMYDSSFISKYGNPEYEDREFLGMSGLDFKWNKNEDLTHIREIYANYLYLASGVITQHAGLSNLSITNTTNNKTSSMGLCMVYEPSSKSIIKRSLKSDTHYINMSDWSTEKKGTFGVPDENYGDLYKCIYGADLTKGSISGNNVGVGNISGSYIPLYDRKTNKEVDYNDTLLRNAVEAISTGNYETISQYVDLEYLAICEAVGYVVGNPDSMRYNMNNYMVYLRRTDGKMVFIPIDTDRCFGITKDWNVKDGYMYTAMLDRKNSNNNDTLSLLLNTILAKTPNKSQKLYVDFCNKIKESAWVDVDTFNTYYNLAKESYSEHNFSLSKQNTNYTFEEYITNKMKQITPYDESGSNDQGGSNKEYDNIYIVGTFNDWGNYSSNELSKYKLNKVAENTYSITVTVTKGVSTDSKGSYVKFKFNNGYNNYDQIDWKLSEDLKTLITECNNSQFCYGVKIGDTITVTINTKTLEASVVIN